MHTTTLVAVEDHPPHTITRRVSFIDRAALRVGIALITWSRRPFAPESRERRATRAEHEFARLERERAWQSARLLRH